MGPQLHRAESAARGFALSGDPEFVKEYRESSAAVLPALDRLIETVKDNASETRLIEETKALVTAQIAAGGELIRLHLCEHPRPPKTNERPSMAALLDKEAKKGPLSRAF